MIIDLDATLVTTGADKQDAAPTWKRPCGYHPLLAMDTERGEVVAVLIRLRNAGSDTATGDVTVLGEAVAVPPERNVPARSPAIARQRCRSACASGRTLGHPRSGWPRNAGTATSASALAMPSSVVSDRWRPTSGDSESSCGTSTEQRLHGSSNFGIS